MVATARPVAKWLPARRATVWLTSPARWTLARQFLVAHLAIVLVAVLVTGAWIGNQIESSVLNRTAGVTALYVDSVITPRVQSLTRDQSLDAGVVSDLDSLVAGTELGKGVVVFKIWSPTGQVLYSPDRSLIGRQFPVQGGLARAVRGDVSSEVSDLDEPENVDERQRWSHLLEVYAPVRSDRTGQLIAINEFYLLPDALEEEIGAARLRAWLVVGAFGALLYLLSAGIIKLGSTTIQRQRSRLEEQMAELGRLHDRVRQAARRTTALNEQALRRVSADLHDGPGQALALALLRFDALRTQCGDAADLRVVENSVRDALKEVRAISSGLRLPELESRPLGDVVERAIGDHERHSGVSVERSLARLPEQVPVAIKIALLRTLQEALSNATRHGRGLGVAVSVNLAGGLLCLEVLDRGPGFDTTAVPTAGHLGLAGMRERAELLGGSFTIGSEPGTGTTVRACWPLLERAN